MKAWNHLIVIFPKFLNTFQGVVVVGNDGTGNVFRWAIRIIFQFEILQFFPDAGVFLDPLGLLVEGGGEVGVVRSMWSPRDVGAEDHLVQVGSWKRQQQGFG